jgi:hypothetical protein
VHKTDVTTRTRRRHRFCHVQVADRRLAVVEGKGGHRRIAPAANQLFDADGRDLW